MTGELENGILGRRGGGTGTFAKGYVIFFQCFALLIGVLRKPVCHSSATVRLFSITFWQLGSVSRTRIEGSTDPTPLSVKLTWNAPIGAEEACSQKVGLFLVIIEIVPSCDNRPRNVRLNQSF